MASAFVDTNVFIYGFEFAESNSAKIVDLINKGKLQAFITQKVLDETVRYLKKFHNKKLAHEFRRYLVEVCVTVQTSEIKEEMRKNKGKIKDKDLQQISAAKYLQLKLISYDRDFDNFEEYITPKEFIKASGKVPSNTEY